MHRRAPSIKEADPAIDATTDIITVAVAAGAAPPSSYTKVKVTACGPEQSTSCPSQECPNLDSCQVAGLASGTAYSLTAVLLSGTTVVSEESGSATASTLFT